MYIKILPYLYKFNIVLFAFLSVLVNQLLKGQINQRMMVMPASIHQPPPPPPHKNIKNAILAEVAHEIEEAISKAVEKNDANMVGSL